MKTLKQIAVWSFAAFMLLAAASCKNSSQPASEPVSMTTSGDTLTIDEVLSRADSLVGQAVILEGVCTHICEHGGQKIFLMGSDDTQMLRVEASKQLGSFPKETVNSIVAVEGVIVEDRIDEAYLRQWEQQLEAAAQSSAQEHATQGCSVEQQARGESATATARARIENYRQKIAQRKQQQGKDYLSFYHAEASAYRIK